MNQDVRKFSEQSPMDPFRNAISLFVRIIRNQFGMVPVKILSTELNKFVRRFGTLIGEVFGPRKDAEGGRFRHRNLTPTGEVLGPRNGRRR